MELGRGGEGERGEEWGGERGSGLMRWYGQEGGKVPQKLMSTAQAIRISTNQEPKIYNLPS